MNPLLVTAVLVVTPAAPVPKPPPPNPLAWAYMGVQLTNSAAGTPLRIDSPAVGTPAYKAGLLGGDVLVKVGDLEPTNFDQIVRYVFEQRPGTVITIKVRRGDEVVRTKLTLEERPQDGTYTVPQFLRDLNPNRVEEDDR